ncbi:MAG TPA: YbfB/YjiJ family MFS transporter [Azospirillaceae bacterium]|nr:YbfB/YjiJ family MFS transporter [Azospirillaceae bacterium]
MPQMPAGAVAPIPDRDGPGALRATLAAACASLVGIGLARFAYTPLIPALVAAGWMSPSDAAYAGAANLAGYLAGALAAPRLAARLPLPALLRAMMLLAAVSFPACAFPLSAAWMSAWRFAAGLSGGALMVLAAPAVLPHVAPERRGLAGGVIFAGVGLGVAASGTLVPALLSRGLEAAWAGLGAAALLLTLLAWNGWPARTAVAAAPGPAAAPAPGLAALCWVYGLNAVGLVPHMVFLADYVARGLGRGIGAGAWVWVLFGLGAVAGPLLLGRLADRLGFGRTLRLALPVQAACVALPLLDAGELAVGVSAVLVGAFVPGIVPVVLGRVHRLVSGEAARRAAWSRATAAFALGQAAGAYALSFLFDRSGGDYRLLFAAGAGALLLALAVELATASHAPSQAKEDPS